MFLSIACGAKPAVAPRGSDAETLAFSAHEAHTWNYFYRRGAVAAHLLATSGEAPRVIVAFPAANSGIGLWFDASPGPVEISLKGELTAVERPDGMRGVRAVLHASRSLRTTGVVMSSVRVLRDYTTDRALLPKEITNDIDAGPPLVVRRTTLDGGHHFELRIEPQTGATVSRDAQGAIALSAPGELEVAVTFLQDDPQLTPISLAQLLTDNAAPSVRDRDALAFLTYREKMLAGSWRFLTYFGRDTLLSTRLLMPVLRPAAIEGALGAVLERLDPHGDVAHEEDIGEFAALRHMREGHAASLEPIYDYKMIDDDFMLAPVVASYVLDTEPGKTRARAFVARHAQALRRNLELVLDRARPFADEPVREHLVALKPGIPVGNWRDSNDGLGGGRYPYDVNTALVPAALDAAARLYDSGLLCACGEAAATAVRMARVWRDKAPALFAVRLPAADARALVDAYAKEQGIPTVPIDAAIEFPAISLDAGGKPVPVMHSDEGFALLFERPPPAELARIASRVARPFPAGLMTPVGMVIANPAFVADAALRGKFARDRYHGAVIWSWQQAMMAAGLARQLERSDLPADVRDALRAAQSTLWAAIRASEAVRLAEHWSWQFANGAYAIYRFGEGGDAEANAAQLWSTVYLAVKPPK
jgi:hypothetical protein